MVNAEVRLESVTWENVDDILANGKSSSDFFPLPHDDDEAERYIGQASNNRRHGIGDLFNAYTVRNVFVGGGQIIDMQDAIQLGYWVVLNKRKKGFGRAIITALEREAGKTFPVRQHFELEIDLQNSASIALAAKMGYGFLRAARDERVIYGKKVHETPRSSHAHLSIRQSGGG